MFLDKIRDPKTHDVETLRYIIFSLADTGQWKFIKLFMDLNADFSVSINKSL